MDPTVLSTPVEVFHNRDRQLGITQTDIASALIGGIGVGTVLTLLFLPALYVAWFRLRPQ